METKLLKLLSLTIYSIGIQPPEDLLYHNPRIIAELDRMSQEIEEKFPGYIPLLIEQIEANDNNYQKAKSSIKRSKLLNKQHMSIFLDQYEIFFCKYFFSSATILNRYHLLPHPPDCSTSLNAEQLNDNYQ